MLQVWISTLKTCIRLRTSVACNPPQHMNPTEKKRTTHRIFYGGIQRDPTGLPYVKCARCVPRIEKQTVRKGRGILFCAGSRSDRSFRQRPGIPALAGRTRGELLLSIDGGEENEEKMRRPETDEIASTSPSPPCKLECDVT